MSPGPPATTAAASGPGGAGRATDRTGPGGACPGCGGSHPEASTRVVIGHDALDALGAFLDEADWGQVVLVSDANTDEAIADTLARRLAGAGRRVTRCSFPERSGLVADRAATEAVRAALRSGAADGAVVAGSGTLNDITRYATHLEAVDYLSVPTAASMDGYASGVAAMQFDGLKVTFPAQAPLGVFADSRVLAAAPAEMTSWGLGDLLGKITARFDWVLSEAVTAEVYCPVLADRVAGPMQRCAKEPGALLAGDEDGISALVAGLVESGITMAMAGSSRPASGAEHHFSHFWDLLAYRGLRDHAPHGLQVAHATATVMRLQIETLVHLDDELRWPPGRRSPDEDPWLGELAAGEQIDSVRKEKAEMWEAFAPRWPPPAAALADARSRLGSVTDDFPLVSAALRALGVTSTGRSVDPSPRRSAGFSLDLPTLRATVRFANRMRSRFSALDLLDSQGRIDSLAAGLTAPRA